MSKFSPAAHHCSHYLLSHPPTVETSHPHCVKFVFHKSGLWCRKFGDHCSMCFQNNLMILFCFPTKHTSFRRSFLCILMQEMQGLSLWCLNFNICDLTAWEHWNIEKTVHSCPLRRFSSTELKWQASSFSAKSTYFSFFSKRTLQK